MRWETLRNGALLAIAADADFVAFITTDQKLEFEQNLKTGNVIELTEPRRKS